MCPRASSVKCHVETKYCQNILYWTDFQHGLLNLTLTHIVVGPSSSFSYSLFFDNKLNVCRLGFVELERGFSFFLRLMFFLSLLNHLSCICITIRYQRPGFFWVLNDLLTIKRIPSCGIMKTRRQVVLFRRTQRILLLQNKWPGAVDALVA